MGFKAPLIHVGEKILGLGPLERLRARLLFARGAHTAIALVRRMRKRAPRPPRAPALVLAYHRIATQANGWEPTRPLDVRLDIFRAQMEALRERFEVVPLDCILEPGDGGSRLRAAVTFDDGYRDNLELAHPVLYSLGLPAAVFVTTRWLGGAAPFWWYELEELSRRGALGPPANGSRWAAYLREVAVLKNLSDEQRGARLDEIRSRVPPAGDHSWAPRMLSLHDLRAMDRSGIWTIGGHTHGHPILARVPIETARAEIIENKKVLEEILGHPLRWFAYPNGGTGDFGEEHVRILCQAGYLGALTGLSPWEADGRDPFRIPRLSVSGLEGLAEFKNHLAGVFWPR